MPPPFEILEHPADVGFRAFGRTREELYEHAALALFTLSCDLATIVEGESREIEVTGFDEEALLYAWLAELLGVSEGEQLVFSRAQVSFPASDRVRGTAYGEPFDRARHLSGTHIKAVTYHQLKVEKLSDGWRAQVFLDL